MPQQLAHRNLASQPDSARLSRTVALVLLVAGRISFFPGAEIRDPSNFIIRSA